MMRLKQHRQDVKTLNQLAVAGKIHLTVMSIADRYMRAILAIEAGSKFVTKKNLDYWLARTSKAVADMFKDAEIK